MIKKQPLLVSFLMLSFSWLSACGTDSAAEDSYYYSLERINGQESTVEDINLYLIDPVNDLVYALSEIDSEDSQPYDIEEIEDTTETLTFTYNGITEILDKKSTSLYKSRQTGIEYSAEKYAEPLIDENEK